jgi:acyl carrier protein
MTHAEIRNVVLDALKRIAPEIDPAAVRGNTRLREEFDLDSMDFLNVVLTLHDRLAVEIPETDYPRLATLDGAVAYLAAKTTATK